MAVMGIKGGTKTWNDRPAENLQRTELPQTISASDRQDKFNGEDVGSVLNKIADPNYVDPSKKMRTVGSDKLGKDAFMSMMLAQMKNQDPTNPLKSHEMAAQMAQFTSVEQMMNMNKTLEEIRNAQKPTEQFQTLNFIGKAVSGDSAKVVRLKGDKEHTVTYNLPQDAQGVQIKIRNSDGDIVRKVDLREIKKGERSWVWNGQNDSGVTTPVGEYQFIIEAKTKDDRKLAVKTDFQGVITGVSQTAEGPVLLVGDQSVKLKDVKKVIDPALVSMTNAKKPTGPLPIDQKVTQDLKNNQGAEETKPVGPSQVLDQVGMTRDMMEKVLKQTSAAATDATSAAANDTASEVSP